MKNLVIVVMFLLAAMAANGSVLDPKPIDEQPAPPAAQPQGEAATVPLEPPVQLASASIVVPPQGETAVTQADLESLRKESQAELSAATAAKKRGNSKVAQHHEGKARDLSRQISSLNGSIGSVSEYYKLNPLSGKHAAHLEVYKNLQSVGFITRGQADERYNMRSSTASPASRPEEIPAEPADGDGGRNMSIIIAVITTLLIAITVAGIVWALSRRETTVDQIDAISQAGNSLPNDRRLVASGNVGGNRFTFRVEPAPVQQAQSLPNGQTLVPVTVQVVPITLGPVTQAAPTPPPAAPAAPTP